MTSSHRRASSEGCVAVLHRRGPIRRPAPNREPSMESIPWSANRWWFGLALACGLAIAAGLFNMRQRLGLGPVDLTLIMTAASVFAGALVSGLAGFAFSAVSGALLFHWLAPVQAVPLLLACSVATQFFSIAKLWHLMQWRRCLPYLAGGLLGIPVGAAILQHVSPHVFAAGFGVILVCYSSYMLLRPAVAIGD